MNWVKEYCLAIVSHAHQVLTNTNQRAGNIIVVYQSVNLQLKAKVLGACQHSTVDFSLSYCSWAQGKTMMSLFLDVRERNLSEMLILTWSWICMYDILCLHDDTGSYNTCNALIKHSARFSCMDARLICVVEIFEQKCLITESHGQNAVQPHRDFFCHCTLFSESTHSVLAPTSAILLKIQAIKCLSRPQRRVLSQQ